MSVTEHSDVTSWEAKLCPGEVHVLSIMLIS